MVPGLAHDQSRGKVRGDLSLSGAVVLGRVLVAALRYLFLGKQETRKETEWFSPKTACGGVTVRQLCPNRTKVTGCHSPRPPDSASLDVGRRGRWNRDHDRTGMTLTD